MKKRVSPSRLRVRRLEMESLESRQMLHGGEDFIPLDDDISPNAIRLQGDRLVIRGDKDPNAIDVALSENGNQIECRVDNLGPIIFALSQVRSIDIRGRGGNDDISVNVNLPTKIRGGRGSDEIGGGPGNEEIWGGPGNDMLDGGPGSNVLRGGRGNDTFVDSDGSNQLPDFDAGKDTVQEPEPDENRIPTANAQTVAGAINTQQSITLTGDDGDADVVQALTFRVQTLPTNGTLRNSAGTNVTVGTNLPSATVTYTPNTGFVGSDNFTFIVMDDGGTADGGQDTSTAATVSLTIPANRIPTATAQSISTSVATARSITLAGDDGEPNANQTLTFRVQSLPTSGTLRDSANNAITVGTVLPSANVTYTPNTGFTGNDSFTFVVVDNGGTASGGQDTSTPATVSITVATGNLRPVANAQTVNASRNTAATITLTGDDGDPNLTQTLSFRVQTLPTRGTLRDSANTVVTVGTTLPSATLSYTPNTGITGSDSFTFIVVDNGGTAGGGQDTSTPATVSISVTQPNGLFGTVTPGSHTDSGLLGIRTDLVTGAPAITQEHVTTAVDYSAHSNPPTYGNHHGAFNNNGSSLTPRPTGVYTTAQPDEDLIHNLEHGHVWISYDPMMISSSDLTALQEFVRAGGTNTGVILTPRPRNNDTIAVASWARLLTLSSFDAAQIRDFIEANRGKAPEGFIPGGQKPDGVEPDLDGLPHTPTT